MAAAAVFEQGDIGGGLPAGVKSSAELEMVGQDVLLGNHAFPNGDAELADMGDGGLARIDEESGAAHGAVVGLAHVRRERADQVEVGSGLEAIRPGLGERWPWSRR